MLGQETLLPTDDHNVVTAERVAHGVGYTRMYYILVYQSLRFIFAARCTTDTFVAHSMLLVYRSKSFARGQNRHSTRKAACINVIVPHVLLPSLTFLQISRGVVNHLLRQSNRHRFITFLLNSIIKLFWWYTRTALPIEDKKIVLSQGNRAMPQLFFSV